MSAPHLERFAYARPLRVPVRGRVTRRGWLVRAVARDLEGWGEAACWPGFGGGARRARRALLALERDLSWLASARAGDVDGLGRALERCESPEARHAAELAALDLAARASGRSLARLLWPEPRTSVAVHALVDDAPAAVRAMARGATTIKLKVGGAPWADDLARVRRVRQAAPGARVRVDVNGAWSVDEALPRLRALADLGVDLVEQPTPPGDVEALRRARVDGGARVAVDEGLRDERDLEAVLARAACDAVVLKPQALGGVLAARRLALRARAAGLEVVVTHSLEAAVGRAGALALAAGLDGDPVCGLGPALLDDVAALPPVVAGRASLPAGAGLGVVPEVSRLARAAARHAAPGFEGGRSWS